MIPHDVAAVEAFWRSFLATFPDSSAMRVKPYSVDAFGDSPRLADELGTLAASGVKSATCASPWEYEAEGTPIPKPGLLTVVVDGHGRPLCIVETVEVQVRAFQDVDPLFAFDEGEGDRSIEHWRRSHWDFFSRTLPLIGRAPSEDMPLVCARFRLLFSGGASEDPLTPDRS
ncbi:MAG: ASCH domain-containing protein [Acidobacteriota bacterium]